MHAGVGSTTDVSETIRDGGSIDAALIGLVIGAEFALPVTLLTGPEHYLEVLF